MSNYNEALDAEKRTLSLLVETSFYSTVESDTECVMQNDYNELVVNKLLRNPSFIQQIVQLLKDGAVNA